MEREALELFAEISEHARSEDGTIEYWTTTDLTEPNVVHFFEQYENETALEAHSNTNHYER